ncbi:MAG: hypothetical protein WCN98_16815 [Verrucomicrobiaceae bacterium]
MNVSIKCDLSQFTAQMQLNRTLSKKTGAEFLNKRSVQVLIGSKGYQGAVNTTKKTTKEQIRKDLGKKYGVGTQQMQTKGKNKGKLKKKITWIQKPRPLLVLLAGKALRKQGIENTPSNMRAMMLRIFKARDASRAYLAAGWLAAVREMGYTQRSDNSRSLRPVGTSRGRIGYGTLATEGNLRFVAYNDAVSNGPQDNPARREAIVTAGLNLAIQNQIADMKQYLQREMEKTLLKNSDAKVK